MKYARVVFPLPQDLSFSYSIPDRLASIAQPGSRVVAPLGESTREGVIVELMEEPNLPDDSIEIKNLADCLDEAPTFSSELLALTKWIAEYYLASWGETLKCALPAIAREQQHCVVHLLATDEQIEVMKKLVPLQAQMLATLRENGDLSPNQLIRRVGGGESRLSPVLFTLQEEGLVELKSTFQSKSKPKTALVVSLAKSPSEIESAISTLSKRATKQAEVLRLLIDELDTLPIASTEITQRTDTDLTTLRSLERKGLIQITSVQVVRNPLSLEPVPPTQPLPLNAEQAQALYAIQQVITQDRREVFLLHGVTGSGKTEVYMQAMTSVLESGKGAIVLVPEISLTPQTVSRFVGRFGARVAVLHSRLSPGERYDQWQRIKRGDADIVVGPRSAIFAPMPNLGLIVIDEEHETSYKQEAPSPLYHAREVAAKRSELANCPLILGSATPSLESFYRAQCGEYRLLSLPSRVSNIGMPAVKIVDMREELKKDNRTIFSTALRTTIEDRLSRREQVILFLNRRGYSTYVFCRTCGYVERCNNCSVSLTFHFETKQMVCHHCGDERPTSKVCPQCGSMYIRYFGLGTEQVEREVIKAFPTANIKRMDTDSTTYKDAHHKILDAFKKREIDILVGTQMIAKGLDFPNVTLVGVISADTALNLPDFRAGERAFNLLTQVAGRSGRGEAGGDVIIQTYMPEHYSIQAAQGHDYLRFYHEEIGYRKQLLYPPLSHAATITLRGKVEEEVIQAANALLGCLEQVKAEGFPDVEIRGPVAAPLSKIMGKFRWHFLLRSECVEKLRELIRGAIEGAPPVVTATSIDLIVDIDPISVL
ncbi:primosomal protein N' [Candidatus Poribacteria bacterium]|nr:primosomal protein N' [Candidatus Poribacteria bacterium]